MPMLDKKNIKKFFAHPYPPLQGDLCEFFAFFRSKVARRENREHCSRFLRRNRELITIFTTGAGRTGACRENCEHSKKVKNLKKNLNFEKNFFLEMAPTFFIFFLISSIKKIVFTIAPRENREHVC